MAPEKSAALTTPTARVTASTVQSWLRDRPTPGERQSVRRIIPGLDLYIPARGPGSWVARLQPRGRTPEGKRWPLRFLKLGNTDTHALSEAIAELRQLQLQVMRGRDPGAERREAVQARAGATAAAAEASAARTSCRQALDAYQIILASRPISASHAADEIAQVRLGLQSIDALDLPLVIVKVAHVEEILAASPPSSRRARYGALSRFLRWGLRREDPALVPPTTLLDPHERPKPLAERQRVLSARELAAIHDAVETLPNAATRDLLWFLITTPCRESEAAAMLWRDVDLSAATWTQTHTKNGVGHVFPLNDRALAILHRRWLQRDGAQHPDSLVFPGHRGGNVFIGWSSAKTAIDRRLDGAIGSPWRFHDLRRSAATHLGDLGYSDGLIDLALNHLHARTRSRLSGTYILSEHLPERADMLAAWSAFLDRALDPTEPEPVPAPRRLVLA